MLKQRLEHNVVGTLQNIASAERLPNVYEPIKMNKINIDQYSSNNFHFFYVK